MPWLKYELCHSHGYSAPQYVEISEGDDLEDMKAGINYEFGDGFRNPKFEVVERLPLKVLADKLEEAEHELKCAKVKYEKLHALWLKEVML